MNDYDRNLAPVTHPTTARMTRKVVLTLLWVALGMCMLFGALLYLITTARATWQ